MLPRRSHRSPRPRPIMAFGRFRIAAVLTLLTPLACADRSSLEIPAPTGDRAHDQDVIATVLAQAIPGDIIRFGPGTYVIGGEGLVIATPEISLRGHPDGTTLVGCTSAERSALSMEEFWETCNGFTLAGEGQHVSDIRFEGFENALTIRHPRAVELPDRDLPYVGGLVIENNVFQDVTSLSIRIDADSVVQVRDNVFRNSWHAIAMGGRNIRIMNNDISVPEPERVSIGFPGGAIGLRPSDGVCESVLVEGNRIDGHTEGVMVAVFPQDEPGSSCSDITVRDNEILMRPVYYPENDRRMGVEELRRYAGKPVIAPAILVRNVQPLVEAGDIDWPEFWMPEGGWPPELANARIHDVLVEGNRITGAIGVGIEVVGVEDIQVLDNEIEVRAATTSDEIDGLHLGGNAGPGAWVELGFLDAVNGTPVWASDSSQRVTIRGRE